METSDRVEASGLSTLPLVLWVWSIAREAEGADGRAAMLLM